MTTRILSIDGGGTRGLFPATILRQLEIDLGKKITEVFDVIIGAATGGIIVSAIAGGLPMEQIQQLYLTQARALLPKNIWRQFILFNPLNLFRAKYTNKSLYQVLKDQIGDQKTLDDVFKQYGEKTIFLIPSMNLQPYLGATDIPGFGAVIFNSAYRRDKDIKLIDVAMRTSAAPINLPIYQRHAEGGIYANDPSVFGVSFALNAHADRTGMSRLQNSKLGLAKTPVDLRVLSLGCGSSGASYVKTKHLKNPDWGLFKWQRYLISLIIDTNMVANQYLSKELLPEENFMRINAYYQDEAAPEILRSKKFRLDVVDPAQLDAIKSYASDIYQQNKLSILSFINK